MLLVIGPAWAGADNKGDAAQADAKGSSNMTMSDGEVRKVDTENKKITLKHGEIKNLGMPPMTMVFQIADPALLGRVKPGDKIRFMAEKQGGSLVVTHIEAAP